MVLSLDLSFKGKMISCASFYPKKEWLSLMCIIFILYLGMIGIQLFCRVGGRGGGPSRK